MVQALMVVGGSVLTLFLLMAVGFWFGRMGLLSDATLSQVSRILLYIVTPSIMITSFEVERTPASQGQLVSALAAMTGVYVVYMLLSQLLFPREGEEPIAHGLVLLDSEGLGHLDDLFIGGNG